MKAKIERRGFLKMAALASGALLLPKTASAKRAEDGFLLNPKTQPKFVNPLPVPPVIDAQAGGNFTIAVEQHSQWLGLINPDSGEPMATTVWGYNGYYPGPTFVTRKGVPISVDWENALVDSNNAVLPHLLPIDPTIDWALGGYSNWQDLGVPVVTHLHGGHTPANSDGLPDAWFTPFDALRGPLFNDVYQYPNEQEAATLWYHDHALGITRLNVYAGLAGFHLLRDANEEALASANQLPVGPYELGLAIQDRMFTATGQLFYPSTPPVPTAPTPSILPEFFGDFILVNGMAWPFLEVEPRQYRFRILNGSDSRFYSLSLGHGQRFHQIGSDAGFLNTPVSIHELTLGPGERADVIVDFSHLAGKTIVLGNGARTPFPKGSPIGASAARDIMAFRVTKPLDSSYPITTLPTNLRPVSGPVPSLVQTGPTRRLILFESVDEFGRLLPLLGTVEEGALRFFDPVTENPQLHETEVWEVYNLTPDTHPIHLHSVSFQLLDRQKFRGTVEPNGELSNIRKLGQPDAPDPNETGWKDTVQMPLGEVTRIIMRFDVPGEFVWHCHILSHEDHEMMRPLLVGSAG